jgi:hypothetical protein
MDSFGKSPPYLRSEDMMGNKFWKGAIDHLIPRVSRSKFAQMPYEKAELNVAIRNVAEAQRIIARQRDHIDWLKAIGAPDQEAEETLEIFEETLEAFRDHEALLRIGIEERKSAVLKFLMPG